LFYNTGVLWLCYNEHTAIVDEAIPFAEKHSMPFEYMSVTDIRRRYEVINTADLHHAYLDPYGGYLKAREATQAVVEAFVREGGEFIQASVTPGKIASGALQNIVLSNGLSLSAASYVFACGSWLSQIFPDVLQGVITCTKQEVYYFGVPATLAKQFDDLPVWVDVDGKDFYYGIPGNTHRGFKIGVDIRGNTFDPTNGERTLDADVLSHARKFLAHRFPALQGSPLLENRVCPYENSRDGNFVIDVHPEASNIVFLGGGSGHGFKHGPALGELVANLLSQN
jgi:glycine/D-amino acid oxidase-like deaminating enzyme